MDSKWVTLLFVGAIAIIGLIVGGSLLLFSNYDLEGPQQTSGFSERDVATTRPAVQQFCGNCHPTPEPSSFPKSSWAEEVDRGFNLYFESGRTDLALPNLQRVTEYYEFLAPTKEEYHQVLDEIKSEGGYVSLTPQDVPDSAMSAGTSLAHMQWTTLNEGEAPSIIFSDMGANRIGKLNPLDPSATTEILVTAPAPAHVEVVDLDQDGRLDLVVGCLGSIRATDELIGSVRWFRQDDQGDYEEVVLADEIGRTCDVRAGDFDNDGDLDLAVAEFGWLKTGHLFLLIQNQGSNGPTFEKKLIDSRHGTVSINVVDINDDGKLDILSLVSQEYEMVDAFINQGNNEFRITNLYQGPQPSYGSSHIETVDLDQDNDLDILYANGDSFDSDLIKPYHQIQWLENEGDLKFQHHPVGLMPGAHCAIANDIDQDGDLDLIASSFLPKVIGIDREKVEYDSVVVFENDGSQSFSRHTLEKGNYSHAFVVVEDFDADGDDDVVVTVAGQSSVNEKEPLLRVWLNGLKP